jgi:hypothetical protein
MVRLHGKRVLVTEPLKHFVGGICDPSVGPVELPDRLRCSAHQQVAVVQMPCCTKNQFGSHVFPLRPPSSWPLFMQATAGPVSENQSPHDPNRDGWQDHLHVVLGPLLLRVIRPRLHGRIHWTKVWSNTIVQWTPPLHVRRSRDHIPDLQLPGSRTAAGERGEAGISFVALHLPDALN